jgi:hypothetical protein
MRYKCYFNKTLHTSVQLWTLRFKEVTCERTLDPKFVSRGAGLDLPQIYIINFPIALSGTTLTSNLIYVSIQY